MIVNRHVKHGFTLLEVLLSLGMLVLLSSGIYTVTVGVFQLSSELRASQKSNYKERRLIEILEHNFSQLPRSAEMQLIANDRVSRLYLKNVPFSFSLGTQAYSSVVLEAKTGDDSNKRLRLLYLDRQKTAAFERDLFVEEVASAYKIDLVGAFEYFQWEAQDPVTKEWAKQWYSSARSRRPYLMELTFRSLDSDRQVTKYSFWIPQV